MVGKNIQRSFVFTLLSICTKAQNATYVLQYVDPLIGSANGGLSIITLPLDVY
jgi:hypothetical protein